MVDKNEAFDKIAEIVSEHVLDNFVRELLADLRDPGEGNEAWAESTTDWLINRMYGDPDYAPPPPAGVEGFSITGR